MKSTIKFMLDLGYDLHCGRHQGGAGFFAIFYRQPNGVFISIPTTDWFAGGHGHTLKEAIENAADIACGIPETVIINPEEFLN
jgi:hypothetical protein